MKLEFKQLEEYENLSIRELKDCIIRYQAELDGIDDEKDADLELQKALELVNARKSVYNARKKQLKGLLKTLNMICRQRGLYANK